MSGRTVVVFTAEFDITADVVISELQRRGTPVFRCNPADFPHAMSLGARLDGGGWAGHLRGPNRVLDLNDVACAWWRRPGPIRPATGATDDEWVSREARSGLRGVLATLPWLNCPDDIRAAEHKPVQLAVARRVGLCVPPTLVTNDPAEVRTFAAEHGDLIYKPMSGGLLSNGRVIYASPVDLSAVDDSVTVTANLFQQQIKKAYELRATVVDENIFTARIDALTDLGRRDWRADYGNLRYSTDALPCEVADKIRTFMHLMRLRFAALDFIVTPDGEHVFLEANPNGQWAWIEDETGLPIGSAIADALEDSGHG